MGLLDLAYLCRYCANLDTTTGSNPGRLTYKSRLMNMVYTSPLSNLTHIDQDPWFLSLLVTSKLCGSICLSCLRDCTHINESKQDSAYNPRSLKKARNLWRKLRWEGSTRSGSLPSILEIFWDKNMSTISGRALHCQILKFCTSHQCLMLSQHCYISPSEYTILTVPMCQHWANDSFNTDSTPVSDF